MIDAAHEARPNGVRMKEIISGLIIGSIAGIVAGIASTAIISLWRRHVKQLTRKEQIRFIRSELIRHFKRMQSVEVPSPAPDGMQVSADNIRFAYFREWQREFRAHLLHRTTALTYDQLAELQVAMETADNLMEDLPLKEHLAMPLTIVSNLYKGFSDLKWLDLPLDKT